MRKIIGECYKKTEKIISDNKDLLDLIANALLKYETLTKEQIEYLVKNGRMPDEEENNDLLKSLTLAELKEKAKDKGIKGYSKMSKEQLIDELKK